MFEPNNSMSWLYYVAIPLFFLYVMYSLYYMAKRTFSLRRQRLQRNRDLAVQEEPEMLSIEDMIEREREDGKAKALRLRRAMGAFDYEVYSEDTTIAAVSLVTQSFREDGDDNDDENAKKGGVKRTTLVLDTENKEATKSSNTTTSKRRDSKNLRKCCSGWDSSKFSNDAESLINGSIRTNGTVDTALIPDGDESTTALSRKLDKELGLKPECVICLEPYEYGQVICSAKIESCGHIFHADCIQQWVQQNEECPLCRVKLILPEESV